MFHHRVCYLILIFFLISCEPERDSTKAFYTDLTESVYASGKIISKDQYNVYSTNAGVIVKLHITEGQKIKQKQELLRIKNETGKLSTLNARAALDLAIKNQNDNSAQLKELDIQRMNAQHVHYTDSINYERQKLLFERNIGSKSQLENLELKYRNSINQISIIQQKIKSLQDKLDFDLEQAANNYRMSVSRSDDFTINSKMDGEVFVVNKEEGELVLPQEVIAVIGNAKEYLLELEIDEEDITKVVVGKKTLITMDAYEGQVFEAKVSKIYPMMNQQNQSFKVEAYFIDAPKVLYPYMSAEANIIIQEKKNILVLEREYFNEDGTVVGEGDSIIKITTGIKGTDFIEITGGIDDNTVIYKLE